MPLFDQTPDLIRTPQLGDAVAATLGGRRAVLLTHHGVVFTGASIAEAVVTGVWLEQLCRTNLLLAGAQEVTAEVDRDVAAAKAQRTFAVGAVESHWRYLRRGALRPAGQR